MSTQNNDKIVLSLDEHKTTAQFSKDLKRVLKQLPDLSISGRLDGGLDEAQQALKESERSMRSIDKLGASFQAQMTQAAQSISKWLSLNTVVSLFISQTQNAVKELRQVDTLLTQIGAINSGLSRSDLARIGDNAFDAAGTYGQKASDYLTGVQEALRAGYDNAEAISELSLAAQTAGGMTSALARQMILATDRAFHMNGSVTELTKALDGMNEISNQSTVTMADISEGIAAVGAEADSFGIGIGQTAAALGTMIDAAGGNAPDTADAFRSILFYIRQICDEDAGIDAAGLSAYEAACASLNVRLVETKNGILSLRDPMAVLGELADAYRGLDENDVRRNALLDAVGGGSTASQLDALLSGWDTYESMLAQYENGAGSMAREAELAADSWEGSLNRLSNTWTATLGNIADSDAVAAAVNGLNSLLSVVERITDVLGSMGTIGLGAGLFAGIKNAGRVKRNPSYRICLS